MLHVKGERFRERTLGSPAFHVLRFTFSVSGSYLLEASIGSTGTIDAILMA